MPIFKAKSTAKTTLGESDRGTLLGGVMNFREQEELEGQQKPCWEVAARAEAKLGGAVQSRCRSCSYRSTAKLAQSKLVCTPHRSGRDPSERSPQQTPSSPLPRGETRPLRFCRSRSPNLQQSHCGQAPKPGDDLGLHRLGPRVSAVVIKSLSSQRQTHISRNHPGAG
jgi:hypothetical protein